MCGLVGGKRDREVGALGAQLLIAGVWEHQPGADLLLRVGDSGLGEATLWWFHNGLPAVDPRTPVSHLPCSPGARRACLLL